VTIALRAGGVRGVILDIEGTTTPVSFVYDVLFPYARTHLREFLRDFVEPDDRKVAALAARMEALMDADSKDAELKRLQGQIWERGYRDGTLHGDVFPDVPPALKRWRAAGLGIAIFSSGSVLAQKLLLGSTPAGDLTRFFDHFFDTDVGSKRSADSYREIARVMRHPPADLLFVSDVVAELRAARTAAMRTALSVRPGNAPQPADEAPVVRSFDEIAA
jgi:enolase-phosphatase E1